MEGPNDQLVPGSSLCISPVAQVSRFTISAVLTLAMAIGANAVVFSVLNGLILRPLNVPQAESLYSLQRTSHKDYNQSYPDYLDLSDRNDSFDELVAYSINQVALD